MSAQLFATLLVPIAYLLMWAVEERWPARPYVAVSRWRRLGVAFFVMVAVIGSITPVLWSRLGLTALRVLDLEAIGWWGLPVGILVTSGVEYGWHRAVHRFDVLWRSMHQLHHSAQRIDVPGAFFTHPLEVFAKTTIAVLVGTVLLGLAPAVASMLTSTLALLSIFQHWNIRTPRWLGWFLPRPEMHALHHELGVHGRNYGDLPIWDLLLGSYVNPERFDGQVGLGPSAAGRLSDMLLMRDVSTIKERCLPE